ncbi:hypothetical protein [Nonomuraea sp. NPDC023979]|uniref:hypothetical protein n=1 Tax=Nonomuraea sp. NPDC023979 TaxID=3154796 RepID=UPI0033DBFE48
MSEPPAAVDHDRRTQAIIFNTLTTQSRALRLDLSLTDRDTIADAVIAALAARGYTITYTGSDS